MAVVESLDLLLHLPLLLLCIGHLQQRLHLGEQPPPGPVAQLQVALDVALDDADGAELLHSLLVGPGNGRETGTQAPPTNATGPLRQLDYCCNPLYSTQLIPQDNCCNPLFSLPII